jgi:hypothetical protein
VSQRFPFFSLKKLKSWDETDYNRLIREMEKLEPDSVQALIRFTFNAGLMKSRRGFTLVAGKERPGEASSNSH